MPHPLGGRQVDEGLLQVAQGALHQAARLLEAHQQRVPQWLLGQYLQATLAALLSPALRGLRHPNP